MKRAIIKWEKQPGPICDWALKGFDPHGQYATIAYTRRNFANWLIHLRLEYVNPHTIDSEIYDFSSIENAHEFAIDYYFRNGWIQISEQMVNLI